MMPSPMEPRSWREDRSRKRLGFSAYDQSMSPPPPPPPPREPASRRVAAVKVDETLADRPENLDCVDRDHLSGVTATIKCVFTLEDVMPKLETRVRSGDGFYALIFRGCNERINLDTWYERMRRNPDPKMPPVLNVTANPETGTLVVRSGHSVHDAAKTTADDSGFDRGKRLRFDTQGLEPPSVRSSMPVTPSAGRVRVEHSDELHRVIETHYDTSEVHAADMTSVLGAIETVTRVDPANPLFEYSIERQTHFYTVTLKGFTDIVDFDTVYAALRLDPDPRIHSLPYLAINPFTGTLHMRIGMAERQRGPARDQDGRLVRKRGRG